MAWTIYTTDLADSLLGPVELATIAKHMGLDVRADVLRRIVSKVRGYCGASGGLGVEGSIPEECEDALATLYRYALLANLPTSPLLTEARTEEKKEAERFLTRVADGKVAISRPDPVTVPVTGLAGSGPVSPSINTVTRRRDRTGLDGS